MVASVVIRDAVGTDAFSNDRYQQMRDAQQQAQPEPSVVLPVNEAPVLPPPPNNASNFKSPFAPSGVTPQ